MSWAIPELENILKSCEQNKSLAVFDIDSTILDVTPRSQEIIKDFKDSSDFQKLSPEDKNNYKKIDYQHNDWGPTAPMKRAGLSQLSQDIIFNFWWSKFFINDYLCYDKPYPGADTYMQKLFNTGCDIAYLTARKKQSMYEGTLESLRQLNFPLDNNRVRCVLKEKDHNDHTYKLDWLQNEATKYSQIFYFENEAKIINHVRQELPDLTIIFMDTIHSQEEPSPAGLITLPGYFQN